MSDVFISYAREDQPFVRRLQTALSAQEIDVWVDWEDIPPTAEWMREVEVAIEGADTFVFVLSPDSLESHTCAREFEHAALHGKRVAIVGFREVPHDAIPDRVRAATWIWCRPTDDLDGATHELVGVIRADTEWVHEHTRLILRSVEWERRQHDRSVLLRGRDLEADERWQAEASVHASPSPTGLQLEYIAASRRATTRGLRLRLGALLVALSVAIGLTVVALIERAHATQQSNLATARELAASAVAQQSKDSELSLQLAVASVKRARTDAGERALRQAIADSRIRLTINVGSRRKPVDSVLFTPDGRRVVAHGSDGTLRVFDARHGTLIAAWRERGVMSRDARAFNPDGSRFLTVDAGNAKIWDTSRVRRGDRKSGHPLLDLGQEGRPVRRASFNPDGTRVVTADVDGSVRIWDALHGGAPLVDLSPPGPVSEALFSSDGTRILAMSGASGTAWIYDADAGGAPLAALNPGSGRRLVSAAWIAADTRVALTGLEGTAIFRSETGEKLAGISTDGATELVASPDSIRLVVANLDGSIEIRSAVTGGVVRALRPNAGFAFSAAYSPDGNEIATATADGAVRLWDADPPVPERSVYSVTTVAVSGDGRHALTARGNEATVSLWRVAGDALLATDLFQLESPLLSAAFSADSKTIAIGELDGSVGIWRVQDRRELIPLPQQQGQIATVAFSPDGKFVLVVSGDATASSPSHVLLYRVDAPRRAPIEIHDSDARSAAFAPKGHGVLTFDSGGQIRLWDASRLHPIRFDTAGVVSTGRAAFSPDGTRFATADADGARVWDVKRPRGPVLVVRRATGPVLSVAYSPDGRRLLTGDNDGSVTLWDARRGGAPLAVLHEHDDRVLLLAFSPDGVHVLSADGTTIRWFACDACRSVDDMLTIAKQRATRPLTDAERRTFLHES